MAENSSLERQLVYFSGRVQGVGFRYTVYQLAKGYEVAGFVQNLSDGRVLLEAEGTEREVRGFLESIENQMMGFIRNTEMSEDRSKPRHGGFSIR